MCRVSRESGVERGSDLGAKMTHLSTLSSVSDGFQGRDCLFGVLCLLFVQLFILQAAEVLLSWKDPIFANPGLLLITSLLILLLDSWGMLM